MSSIGGIWLMCVLEMEILAEQPFNLLIDKFPVTSFNLCNAQIPLLGKK